MELSTSGFVIVSLEFHDLIEITEEEELNYFETPYSLLDSISPAYRQSFGDNLLEKFNSIV